MAAVLAVAVGASYGVDSGPVEVCCFKRSWSLMRCPSGLGYILLKTNLFQLQCYKSTCPPSLQLPPTALGDDVWFLPHPAAARVLAA
jgi:hypothetical protein